MAAWLILAFLLALSALSGVWLLFAVLIVVGVLMYREERAAHGR